jgi:hypothetical protein
MSGFSSISDTRWSLIEFGSLASILPQCAFGSGYQEPKECGSGS